MKRFPVNKRDKMPCPRSCFKDERHVASAMSRCGPRWSVAAILMLTLLTGCPRPDIRQPFPPIPLRAASSLVNRNLEQIRSTLRAVGTVDGYVNDARGRRFHFSLDATLFVRRPDPTPRGGPSLRFDLKKLGDTQLLIGSNAEHCWYFAKEEGFYQCGRHDSDRSLSDDFPIVPKQLVDALGLTPIPDGPVGPGVVGRVQRIEDDHQQILFVVEDPYTGIYLQKEYWLLRYPPRLIDRVVFRDRQGKREMESSLTDYRRLSAEGPWLPYRMIAEWPKNDAHLRFNIRKWETVEQVTPESIQFATPNECGL